MENKVSYIIDEFGNKTHAVVPYDNWLELITNKETMRPEMDEAKDSFFGFVHSVPIVFDREKNDFKKITYIEEMHEHFDCINTFSNKDIGLMYLLYNKHFALLCYKAYKKKLLEIENIDLSKFSEVLYEEYYISNLANQPLDNDDAEYFLSILKHTTDLTKLTREINTNFRFGIDNFKKRIRYDAEIKRIYFFDKQEKILSTQRLHLEDKYPKNVKARIEKTMNVLLDVPVKEQLESIAIEVYPNNSRESAIAQMNKALRDADERINQNKWKEYIGK